MRRSTRRKLQQKLGTATVVLGLVVMGAFGLKQILSSDGPVKDNEAASPFDASPSLIPEQSAAPSDPKTSSANGKHKVVITAESDGPIRVGYRFIDGKTGVKDTTLKFTMTRTLTGSSALAQIGVQLLPDATRATCTVTVDGVQKSTKKATGDAAAVCIG